MNKFYRTNITVLFITALLIILYMGFFPRSSGRSGTETRELTEFPDFSYEALTSGQYTATITDWFTDTIPYRDTILDMASWIRGLYGMDYVIKTDDGKDVHFESDNLQEGINDSRPDGNISDPLANEDISDTNSGIDELPPDLFED